MHFGFITRQIVTGIIAPFLAFQPMIGQLQASSNPYESNQGSSSSTNTYENNERSSVSNNPYETKRSSGGSKQSNATNQASGQHTAQKNQSQPQSNPYSRQKTSSQGNKGQTRSNPYSRQKASAQKQAPSKTGQTTGQSSQLASQKSRAKSELLGGSKKAKNNKTRFGRSSKPNQHMTTSSFKVSNKTGAVSERYTIDHLNALWSQGKDLKLAMTYKSGRDTSIYLPAQKNFDKHPYKTGWDLSLPAIYQQKNEVPRGDSKCAYWKLKWKGSTHTFRPSTANEAGWPMATSDYFDNIDNSVDSTQFIYSQLSGTNGGDVYDFDGPKGQKIVITDGLKDDVSKTSNDRQSGHALGRIDGSDCNFAALSPGSDIKLRTASGIVYVFKMLVETRQPMKGARTNSTFYLKKIIVPLKKSLQKSGDFIYQQIYRFDYAVANAITIYSHGLSGSGDKIAHTKVADISLFANGNDNIRQVKFYTPDYSQNSKNTDNLTEVTYGQSKTFDGEYLGQDCAIKPSKRRVVTRITNPKDHSTTYHYAKQHVRLKASNYCRKHSCDHSKEHDQYEDCLQGCKEAEHQSCTDSDKHRCHKKAQKWCKNHSTMQNKYVKRYHTALLSKIVKPTGATIEIDYDNILFKSLVAHIQDHNGDRSWHNFQTNSYTAERVIYPHKTVWYDFTSVGTKGPTWAHPKDGHKVHATFLAPSVASAFDPTHLYNSAIRHSASFDKTSDDKCVKSSNKCYGLPMASLWLDSLFQTMTSRKEYADQSGNGHKHIMTTGFRHAQVGLQLYGTKKETSYDSEYKPDRREQYVYDAAGRLLKKETIHFDASSHDIIKATKKEKTYAFTLAQIGNYQTYDSYLDLPLYWNKPMKVNTKIFRGGSVHGKLEENPYHTLKNKTREFTTYYEYNKYGQPAALLKQKKEHGEIISGQFWRYTCKPVGYKATYPSVTGMIKFKHGQINGAYFVNHSYWIPNALLTNLNYDLGYPAPVIKTTKQGVIPWTGDLPMYKYATNYAGSTNTPRECTKVSEVGDVSKPTDAYVATVRKQEGLGGAAYPSANRQIAIELGDNAVEEAAGLSSEIQKVTTRYKRNVQNGLLHVNQTREGTEGSNNPASSDHHLTSSHKINRFGFKVQKTTQTGTEYTYAYDKLGRKAKHQIAGKTVKKWKRGIPNNDSGEEAYYVRITDPVHNKVTEKHYNQTGQLINIKHKKQNGSSHVSKSYDWDGTVLTSITQHKYAQKNVNKVGTITKTPIYDNLGNRIGMFNSHGLNTIQYRAPTEGVKIQFHFEGKSGDSDTWEFYGPVKLSTYDRYLNVLKSQKTFDASDIADKLIERKLLNTGSSGTVFVGSKYSKKDLINAIKKDYTPVQKLGYHYDYLNRLGHVTLSYPKANKGPQRIKTNYYNEYGQVMYVEDRHGNHHHLTRNLLGQTVTKKIITPDSFGGTHTVYLEDKAHNALGQLVYQDVRPGPNDTNDWQDDSTYNKYHYDDKGLITKQNRANGTDIAYNIKSNPTRLKSVMIKPEGASSYKLLQSRCYDDYGFATCKQYIDPVTGIKTIKDLSYNDDHQVTRIKTKRVGPEVKSKWQNTLKRNALGQVYQHQTTMADDSSITIGNHAYTDAGRVKNYTIATNNQKKTIHYDYHDTGKLHKVHTGDYHKTFQYNANGQLTKTVSGHKNKVSKRVISKLTYNKAGKIKSKSIRIGSGGGQSRHYDYTYASFGGSAGRLKRRSGSQVEKFKYDPLGNITQIKRETKSKGWLTTNLKYKEDDGFILDHVILPDGKKKHYDTTKQGLVTDAAVTHESKQSMHMRYGPMSKVRKIEYRSNNLNNVITYGYSSKGKPIKKQIRAMNQDQTGEITKTAFKIAGMWSKPVKRASLRQGGHLSNVTNLTYQLPHQLGQIKVGKNQFTGRMVDATGNVITKGRRYSAFGALNPNKQKQSDKGTKAADKVGFYGFKGELTDITTGWQYLGGTRLYDPAIGRFLQPDSDSPGKGGINPYRFATNNPVAHSDPTGHYTENVTTKGQARSKYNEYHFCKKGMSDSQCVDYMKKKQLEAMVSKKNLLLDVFLLGITIATAGLASELAAAVAISEVEISEEAAAVETSEVEEGVSESEMETENEESVERIKGKIDNIKVADATEDSHVTGPRWSRLRGLKAVTSETRSDRIIGFMGRMAKKTMFNTFVGQLAAGHVSGNELGKNLLISFATAGLDEATGAIFKPSEEGIGFAKASARAAGKYVVDTVVGAGLFSVKSHIHNWSWHGSGKSFGRSYLANLINMVILGGVLYGFNRGGARFSEGSTGRSLMSGFEAYGGSAGYGFYFGMNWPTAGGAASNATK